VEIVDERRSNGFGELLRARRTVALLTQEGLADQAGVSVRTVRNLESGSVAPRTDTARRLADALGLPPPLRAEFLQAARGSAVPLPAGRSLPSQLPARPPDLIGRADLAARVAAVLAPPATGLWPPVVAVLTGPAGVGKTTLAVHVAHQVRDRFADGQLFVRLRPAGPHPAASCDILARVLHALGVPDVDLPPAHDDRLGLFRTLMAHRPVLIVLDDVTCEEQVRPLVLGAGNGALLVTGRRRLTALEHAHVFEVEPLRPAEGVALLARAAGSDRVGAEPEAAARIADRCAGLPLALRIAGAKLAARPHLSLARLASRLADAGARLDELSYGDLAIRASIALTYDTLDTRCRTAFRLLSLVDLPSIPVWLAAAVLRCTVADAEEVLDQLVDARLLEAEQVADDIRYRYHDLPRGYARERAAAEDPQDAASAVLRTAHRGEYDDGQPAR
jgi:transcriptional regulator with XRE-family HTH domain